MGTVQECREPAVGLSLCHPMKVQLGIRIDLAFPEPPQR